jgi:hypothetical protein
MRLKTLYPTVLSLREPSLKHCSIWLSSVSYAILSGSFRPADTFNQNIPLIQMKVYDFAEEAIQYIRTLVEAAGEEPSVKGELKTIW